jgi:23S rRNA (guanosine2251-2'-O)-methyltransferase
MPMKQLRMTDQKRLYRQYEYPKLELVFILQSLAKEVNVGSAFRIADACRVREMFLTGITPIPPNATLRKASRGKEKIVPWTYLEEPGEIIRELKAEGYLVCAIEITDASVPYYQPDYPDKVCLIVGNEDHGVTRQTLALCDKAIFIPMYGKGRSLNVHTALAVVAFHVLYQRAQAAQLRT